MSGRRILLVEDERIPAFNLQQRLKALGYEVPTIVTSGTDALRIIAEQRPDLILMDIHIEGDIDGIETARRIPPELMIPVIYLTAYSEEVTLQRAAATKAAGYLVKPFSERELHATIQMALQRHEAEAALRRNEAELRRSREDFRFLFKNSPLPMWVFAIASLKFLDVNDAAMSVYGYSREEFLSMSILDIRPIEEKQRTVALLKGEMPDYMEAHSWRHRRRDGTIMEVDVFSHSLEFEGHPARITVSIDVTQRNRAEEQLRQSQKMEAIGQLTGGVAHDFNNLLAVVQGNIELLAEKITGDQKLAGLANAALQAARRGAILTHRLLAYSRQQPLEFRTVMIGELATDLNELLLRTLGETIDVRTALAPDLWPIQTDPHELENALLNLAVNGRDAMPHGGNLTIEAANVVLGKDYAADDSDVTPGDYVMVAVTDSGTGMAPDVVRRAFEPYFTTKPVGRGTGLGLSMVFGFVKQSGGHVKIYSEFGRGTTVKLYLPRAGQSQEPDEQASEAERPRVSMGETIMVVEDDAGVRALVVTLLIELGYRVLEAEDGVAALERVKAGAVFDLLLSDVVLPRGVSGPACAEEARRMLPQLAVLYMSGYTQNAMQHNRLLEDGVHLIMKPFRKNDLAAKLRDVLDHRPSRS